MGSLSFLKHPSPRGESQVGEGDSNIKQDNAEKVLRRQSKRAYFRSLLKRASLSSQSRNDRRKSAQILVCAIYLAAFFLENGYYIWLKLPTSNCVRSAANCHQRLRRPR
jgi:hypothetical protein